MITLKQLEEEIRQLAYELYEKSGRVHGNDLDHWLQAERIVLSRYFGLREENEDKPIAEGASEEKPRRRSRTGSSSGKSRRRKDT